MKARPCKPYDTTSLIWQPESNRGDACAGQAATEHMQLQGSGSMTQAQRKRKATPGGGRLGIQGVNKRSVKSVAAFLRPTTM